MWYMSRASTIFSTRDSNRRRSSSFDIHAKRLKHAFNKISYNNYNNSFVDAQNTRRVVLRTIQTSKQTHHVSLPHSKPHFCSSTHLRPKSIPLIPTTIRTIRCAITNQLTYWLKARKRVTVFVTNLNNKILCISHWRIDWSAVRRNYRTGVKSQCVLIRDLRILMSRALANIQSPPFQQ